MSVDGVAIDWVHFTPWASLAGGALIGLAAALFVLLNGRIAGISGLLGAVLEGGEGRAEKALFLLGLLLAPLLWGLFAALPPIEFQSGWRACWLPACWSVSALATAPAAPAATASAASRGCRRAR